MSTPPPVPLAAEPAAGVPAPAAGRIGAAEAAIVISAITAVTVLAVLERPVPALLTVLTAASGLLRLPGRLLRLLAALAGGRP
ncbi:hypothetical protein [Streptomyces yaizuensis]|uniref:Energy-coupling factor transporter transmembrane protein EcfT n=1 Tax=Streptomyces yaizuensis TaxID=2989713 RepID=A0ABQ5PBI1_9ACTN|nr:hypothetical protein [Streptomyces sp. YSPA8]GLF99933.1 hypothetical protein SYYSPA8_36570 [Streptomyces sp. YSPA8]